MDGESDVLANLLEQRRHADSGIVEVEAPTVKLVMFAVGTSLFAFPGANVTEILPLTTIYPVPGCPASLEGVINVRGDIASVIRLGDLLGETHAATDRQTAILLGRGSAMSSGLRVDRVVEVLDVLEELIQPPPATLPENMQRWATGVFAWQGRSVLVLNLEPLFQDYRAGLG
ncbi:MAG: purine-binding chemotaxis protein CheW [Pseudomonadota bacterium]|nr:purine-binding chemotaxis protein CheW [Pseudomonadota bacterium]